MRNNENLVRSCMNCECYAIGCEENCPFKVQGDSASERPSLGERRKAMKAEKANAYEKALRKLRSAEKREAEENRAKAPKYSHKKDLKKELEMLEDDRKASYREGKSVFKARTAAIKQARRRICRISKNKSRGK
ncbi:MAG: hypothetical protein HFJ58_02155 [Clostridia bacterium]|nr:hypothetical protein [Clostridia bacterium]